MIELHNSTFCAAMADIGSLGLKVSPKPTPGAQAYAVIGGRSNARWWLVPLQNRYVASSGLALFQPLLPSASWRKTIAVNLSRFGLSRLWVRDLVYISGESLLGQYFPSLRQPSYAYFTGTDSPHRKIAVQVMDTSGGIRGFAKLSRNPAVAVLLEHEAAMLQRVQALGLKSANVPKVLFAGKKGATHLIVTDTRKTSQTRSANRFTKAHLIFLQELSQNTGSSSLQPIGDLALRFAARIENIRTRLHPTWRQRLDATIASLVLASEQRVPIGLSHGDFVPWNTFMTGKKLYVFDWEYAEEATPPSNDILHFVLNQPYVLTSSARRRLDLAFQALRFHLKEKSTIFNASLIRLYIITHVLRQIERLPDNGEITRDWDAADVQAAFLDFMAEKH